MIATIAVIGLAHSFGLGRALINRFEVRRAALTAVQERMEMLAVAPPSSTELALGDHPATPIPFTHQGRTYGTETWTVSVFDDPATTGSADLKRVTARVVLTGFGVTDTVRMTRLFPTQ